MASDDGLISVIVSVYQQPQTLAWLLTCLTEQDCRLPYEVLVCDDGSQSSVFEVVAEACRARRCDLRYVWQPDEGFRVSRSRNNGIRAAQGDLLVFLDGDQVVDADLLERHRRGHTGARQLVAGPVKRVHGMPPLQTPREMLAWARAYQQPGMFPEQQEAWASSPYPWMAVLGTNVSCARRPEVRLDERFVGWGGEDRELAYRLTIQHGYRVLFAPSAISYDLTPSGGVRRGWSHDVVVRFLRNRLHFRALYPDGDLAPALELLRCCHFDATTDTWSTGAPRSHTPEQVLRFAEQWMRDHPHADSPPR